MDITSRFIDGPAGRLDSRWHGDGTPVLLLHPHPTFGGTMGSRFVYDLAEALAHRDYLAVRFNYRGVQRSKGSYGNGDGEAKDAQAVWRCVREATGQAPYVVGYSFGGGVAARLAKEEELPGVVFVATPLQVTGSTLAPMEDASSISCPYHVVVGSRDGFVPVEDATRFADALGAPLSVVERAGHFLEPSHNARGIAAVVEPLDHWIH